VGFRVFNPRRGKPGKFRGSAGLEASASQRHLLQSWRDDAAVKALQFIGLHDQPFVGQLGATAGFGSLDLFRVRLSPLSLGFDAFW
jgi:hypothetical protein